MPLPGIMILKEKEASLMESILESLKGTGKVDGAKLISDKDYSSDKVRILVVGAGGGGCNTITRITNMGISSAETVAVNTDNNHLKITNAKKKLLIGSSMTRGLGAGGYPEIGMKCAEISKDQIRQLVSNSELVFLCAGMGGGTGTGSAPVIAQVAKDEGAIVIGMVTYPFNIERARLDKAKWGIEQLSQHSDTVVIIDNNRLLSYVPNLPMNEAFKVADEVVARAVKGISDTITFPSLINIDFADIKTIMTKAGAATISVGEGRGTNKVEHAIRSTLDHPLLDVDFAGAKGALVHIAGGADLTLGEATKIGEGITEAFDDNANVIWGARVIPEMGDSVTVTAVMTGVQSPMIMGNKAEPKLTFSNDLEEVAYV